MDSVLADAGRPAGVVHRIGDLLSVFLEKRLVITLMTSLKIKSVMEKARLPFQSFPFRCASSRSSGRDQKTIPLRPGNWAPKVRVSASSVPRSEPFWFQDSLFSQLFQRRLDLQDGRIEIYGPPPSMPGRADERLRKFFFGQASMRVKVLRSVLEIPKGCWGNPWNFARRTDLWTDAVFCKATTPEQEAINALNKPPSRKGFRSVPGCCWASSSIFRWQGSCKDWRDRKRTQWDDSCCPESKRVDEGVQFNPALPHSAADFRGVFTTWFPLPGGLPSSPRQFPFLRKIAPACTSFFLEVRLPGNEADDGFADVLFDEFDFPRHRRRSLRSSRSPVWESSSNILRQSMKLVPWLDPTDADAAWLAKACVRLPDCFVVNVPERDTTPTFPGSWIGPGMIPILHCPGVITPGQLALPAWPPVVWQNRRRGPCRSQEPLRWWQQSEESLLLQLPWLHLSKRRRNKIILALAPVAFTASWTVLNIGIPSKSWPPFPGVTPATMLVP